RAVYKKCPECRKFLEARKFYKHPGSPDGLMAWCRSCMNCGTVRERPVYNDGERLLGDPSEEQIAAACAAIRETWSHSVRERRRAASWLMRRMQGHA
ncbi:MAG: hypothetical protein EB078_08840, partial [Proteobacteria bacterium]|nr:hypothetical protein [Pseudomonadota bacterium]